jgi:hypothetical protein
MEKITDKINALPDGENYFSLEFFPPKTAMVRYPTAHATLRSTETDSTRVLQTSRHDWSVCRRLSGRFLSR